MPTALLRVRLLVVAFGWRVLDIPKRGKAAISSLKSVLAWRHSSPWRTSFQLMQVSSPTAVGHVSVPLTIFVLLIRIIFFARLRFSVIWSQRLRESSRITTCWITKLTVIVPLLL